MKKTPVVTAAALVCLAVGGFFVWKRPAGADGAGAVKVTASASAGVTKAATSAPARAAARERTFKRGAHFLYDVSATRTFGAPNGAGGQGMTLTGALSFTVVGATDDGAAVRVALGNAKRTDTPAIEKPRATSADFATPFFVVLKGDGSMPALHFPRTMPGEARRYLRSVVSSMQLVDGGAAESWNVTEIDEAGQFVAGYRRDGAGVTKNKLRYELVRGSQGLVPVSTVGKYDCVGGSKLTLDVASGWPATVDEDLVTTATFQGGQLAMKALTKARLLSSSEAREHIGSFEAAMATFDPDTDALGEDMELARKNADEGLVKGATLTDLRGDYEAAKDSKGRTRAVARLGALLRTQPEAIKEARAALLAPNTKEATAKAIASALGSANSPEAQRALADALKSDAVPPAVKNDAAISLGLSEKPSPEGRAALKVASTSKEPDVAATATLALGSAANNMQKSGEDPKDIVADLLARLDAATDAAEKVLVLDALGNSADARALPAIKARVAEPESSVRAAAVGALRFQKEETVDAILSAVVTDPDVMVRKAALMAMAQRNVVPLLAGYDRVIKTEPQADLRKSAIRVLARSVDAAAEVATLLVWSSQNDPDESVKQAATEALSRPRAPSAK